MVMVQLNLDAIADILSRLRVKDLIKFKSVCKSWLQLISNKDFIKLHLQRSTCKVPHPRSYYYYYSGSPPLFPHRSFLRRPQPQCENRVLFVGNSCDGLMCLFNYEFGIIYIWNPSIRESVCFPIKKKLPHQVAFFWFGIHGDEYKIVLGIGPDRRRIYEDYDDDDEYQMHLIRPYVGGHSYKSTTLVEWRKEENRRFYSKQGILFSGNVHWTGCVSHTEYVRGERRYSVHRTILCYNFGDETMGRIGVPESEADREGKVELGEIDGCFSALFVIGLRGYAVWVMKEYGVEESWTNLMFIEWPLGKSLKSQSPFLSREGCVESLVSPSEGTCDHNRF